MIELNFDEMCRKCKTVGELKELVEQAEGLEK